MRRWKRESAQSTRCQGLQIAERYYGSFNVSRKFPRKKKCFTQITLSVKEYMLLWPRHDIRYYNQTSFAHIGILAARVKQVCVRFEIVDHECCIVRLSNFDHQILESHQSCICKRREYIFVPILKAYLKRAEDAMGTRKICLVPGKWIS